MLSPGGVGFLLLASTISHPFVCTGAKAIFTSKFKLFCHFRLSDVGIKGEGIVELGVLGGGEGGGRWRGRDL